MTLKKSIKPNVKPISKTPSDNLATTSTVNRFGDNPRAMEALRVIAERRRLQELANAEHGKVIAKEVRLNNELGKFR